MLARGGFAEKLRRAASRRAPLREDASTTAFRMFNAGGDGDLDVTIDWFDQVAVVSLYRELGAEDERAVLDDVEEVLAPRAVYLKRRPKEARVVAMTRTAEVSPPLPLRGQAVDELTALERGLRFLIRPGPGLSVGLFLDMRDTRGWVREAASGKTVLNCFAYTCAFAVAAHAGGARRVANIDVSRRVLDWGQANARLNGADPKRQDYIDGDVFDWLGRLGKKREQFDLVILDPPSFATTRKSRFSAARDYPGLAAAAAPVLAPGGTLLGCCNLASLEPRPFEAGVLKALAEAGRRPRVEARLGPSSVDFPAPPGEPPALKVLAVRVD